MEVSHKDSTSQKQKKDSKIQALDSQTIENLHLETEDVATKNSSEKEVERLIKSIQKMETSVYRKRREINEITKDIEDTKNMLYDMCEHVWIRDRSDDGPYGMSYTQCSKCNLYRKYSW